MLRTPAKLASMTLSLSALLAVALMVSPGVPTTAEGQITKGSGGFVPPENGSRGGQRDNAEASIAQKKAQEIAPRRAPDLEGAMKSRAAPALPPGVVIPQPGGGLHQGFVSRVGSFELTGPTGLGLYRWLEFPQDPRHPYRFWRSDLVFEGLDRVFYGGAGRNTLAAPRFLRAFVYRDVRYPFWLAFSERPNPDGTFNIAFSLDRNSWYWWDDDARGFDLTLVVPAPVPGPLQP